MKTIFARYLYSLARDTLREYRTGSKVTNTGTPHTVAVDVAVDGRLYGVISTLANRFN